MTSAANRSLTAGDAASKAARQRDGIADAAGAAEAVPESDIAEVEARRSARRFALVLMAGSSVLVVVILGGLWLLLRGSPL